jgi:oligosaccharide repeat unit polymerase
MTSAATIFPPLDHSRLRIPMAAFEVLAYLSIVAAASLAFLSGWLTVNAAVVLTVLLLGSLIVLSWIHLGQGRHPVFLFLCTLMFFQGSRLLAFCLGGIARPLDVQLMQVSPFSIGRSNEVTALLCLVLSGICVYAPCRSRYRDALLPDITRVRHYLPYLYLLFFATLPVQLFKNYRYFEWAQQHGGYSSIYLSHASVAASVPFLVRIVPLISFPTFVAIFVWENSKRRAYAAAILYFAAGSVILLLGARGALFGLILTLWYVARVKSTRRSRTVLLVLFAVALTLLADVVRQNREEPDVSEYSFLPVEFLALQGASLDVLSTVVAYRDYFSPHAWKYPFYELQNAFVPIDTEHYGRGKLLPYDVPVLLNVSAYNLGAGSGGSYIAESYAIGGIIGVVALSLLVGTGLHWMFVLSRNIFGLFLVAMTLPDVLLMPRGELLDWFSVFFRNAISIVLLWCGWKLYSLLISVRRQPEIPLLASPSTGSTR